MLKILKLKKQIELKQNEQRAKDEKLNELQTRAKELEADIEEIQTDEDFQTVSDEIDKVENDINNLNAERNAIDEQINNLEAELKELEEKQERNSQGAKEENKKREMVVDNNVINERGINFSMYNKREIEKGVMRSLLQNHSEVRDYFANLVETMRAGAKQTGVNLVIPNVLLDTITDNLGDTSVLYNEVRAVKLNGTARATVAAEATEAVWTEMTGVLNELDFSVTAVELDGYKLGGYIALHNSHIEDAIVDLATYVTRLMKESFGRALDKAILYGQGKEKKQPTGIVQELKTKKNENIIKTAKGKLALTDLVKGMATLNRGNSNRGEIIFVMNEKTWLGQVLPLTLATNALGAYVVENQTRIPALGCRVVLCNQVPDNEIIFGDFTKYILGVRNEQVVARSEEVRFIEDQTVIKVTQRFDGIPYKLEAFNVILTEGETDAGKGVTFAEDKANTPTI